MSLIGSESRELRAALLDAYPTLFKLTEMVQDELDKDLDAIAEGNSRAEIIFNLVRAAEAEGWTDKLIEAAHRRNPGNEKLSTFYQKYKQRQAEQAQHNQHVQESPPVDRRTEDEPVPSTMAEQPVQNEETNASEHGTILYKDRIDLAHSYVKKARNSVQSAYNFFSSKGKIFEDQCRLASSWVSEANTAVSGVPVELAHIPVTVPSLPYELVGKQQYFGKQTHGVISSINKFSRQASTRLQEEIQSKLNSLQQNLLEIDALIDLFGKQGDETIVNNQLDSSITNK